MNDRARPMDTVIRTAVIADEAGINDIWHESDALHHAALPRVFGPPAVPARSPEVIAALLAHAEHLLLVAELQGLVVGAIHVSLRRSEAPMVPRRFAVVEAVGVATAHRGVGTGRRLVLAAQDWARDQGATEMWLNVWEFNETAIGLYETLGYETVSRRMRLELDHEDGSCSRA